MFDPVTTYRLQLHKDFSFDQLKASLPYLRRLGITTLYASPVFAATPGSTHGYDGIDPQRINTEIGTMEQLLDISRELKKAGMGWLQDIVPNHMAFHSGNVWLMDVLEKGDASPYFRYFDIFYKEKDRLMVPFLGAPLEEVITAGDLRITQQNDKFVFTYHDAIYPLSAESAAGICPAGEDTAICLQQVNSNHTLLRRLADQQHYQLTYWQDTDRQINYRRFFTVNGLICLNIHDPEVFSQLHQEPVALLRAGVFQGLRVDHIDGLYDPAAYLEQLRSAAGDAAYLVVEKILEPGEELPASWPVQGTTGYDFLALVNNLLTDHRNESLLTDYYQQLTGDRRTLQWQLRDKKAHILYEHMGGELEHLYQLFINSDFSQYIHFQNFEPIHLKQAIGEFLIACPVYRFYGNRFPLDAAEAVAVQRVFADIRKAHPLLLPAIEVLEKVLLEDTDSASDTYRRQQARFYQRCMQFTGPLMAKGMEDTLMYTYSRQIARNDVGDHPGSFGMTKDAFHAAMQHRQQHQPLAINTTSTHDTKRGEDVRARLQVLTDIPEAWIQAVEEWRQLNAPNRQSSSPDANDEYFVYQTLLGMEPMPGQQDPDLAKRLAAYLEKAMREAKVHSSWAAPNEVYEASLQAFAAGLLREHTPFRQSFRHFQEKITDFGILNALVQQQLKFTCPGIPDIYQGTELWDLSLVDPDNRRPVDYELRERWLAGLEAGDAKDPQAQLRELWQLRGDGRIKLWLTRKLVLERRKAAALFAEGLYLPLEITGKYKDHVLAFARRKERTWYLTAVPLHLAATGTVSPATFNWEDTEIVLPPEAPQQWEHLLFGFKGQADGRLSVSQLFAPLPLALLKLEARDTGRGAGILLPIASLPSPFGIGDMGVSARSFAEFLDRAGQKYWQLLPLNPTEESQVHSPYSSFSSIAGNTLLISPEMLADEGLLKADEWQAQQLPVTDRVDYAAAEKAKRVLLAAAYARFCEGGFGELEQEFGMFCREESRWLDDFSIYALLRHQYMLPWFEWPEPYKRREPEALKKVTDAKQEEIREIKWQQFVFFRQWGSLRRYCNERGIRLFGDLPFYMGYDAADIWAQPSLFRLDKDMKPEQVAGVPPDYFSETGQLWGMPTFDWQELKATGYEWWIARLRKNLELFDLLRLDHFRAFSEYWEVPTGEINAIKGVWQPGPGTGFFEALRNALGHLPFVAEDLGDNMDDVYALRDTLVLPGMKVLQFAFGGNFPYSVDAPHNFTQNCVVYTGTHDNNTTRGWYLHETTHAERDHITQYAGYQITESDIHRELARMAYASVANTAILPMQDVLGLGADKRTNTPGTTANNWLWRLMQQPGDDIAAWLRNWVHLYAR